MAPGSREPILVEVTRTAPGTGELHAFTRRGVRYPVAEALSSWHLHHTWWGRDTHSDRPYWRVQTPDFGVYERYHDTVSGQWRLDVVQD